MKKFFSSFGLLAGILAVPAALQAQGTAVTHTWMMPQGTLIANWSFENSMQVWRDSTYEGVTGTARHAMTSPAARTGRYAGRAAGDALSSTEIRILQASNVPVLPGRGYTLSFYVRSSGDISGTVRPSVRLRENQVTTSRNLTGTDYATFSVAATSNPNLPNWTLYVYTFSTQSDEIHADIALWQSQDASAAGDLYFDDVILEEGILNSTQVAANRAGYAYEVTFVDALGQQRQRHIRLGGSSTRYRIEDIVYDQAGRATKAILPFPLTRTTPGVYVEDAEDEANDYWDGTNGVPDAGGYAYAGAQHADDPTSELVRGSHPGALWRLGATVDRTIQKGHYFVDDLTVPGNIMSPSYSPGEKEFRLDWSKDEDSVFSLSWRNKRNELVQTARKVNEDDWAFTRNEYYPSGRVRKVLTPQDVEEEDDNFSEVRNYNTQGFLTSSYSKDRGLERYWYNKQGRLRFAQNEAQRPNDLYTYYDYDALGNLASTGTQTFTTLEQESMVDGDGDNTPNNKTEHRGFIYGTLTRENFLARTGVPWDTVFYPHTYLPESRTNSLSVAYHRNVENRAPGFTDTTRLVVDIYEYNAKGEVIRQHKYLGAMRRDVRLQTLEFEYDTLSRLAMRTLYEGSPQAPILQQKFKYDALGRVSAVLDGNEDTLSTYAYWEHGPVKSVGLGKDYDELEGPSGTILNYGYHVRGWAKELTAVKASTDEQIFREILGYEAKTINDGSIPALIQPRYAGQISQKLSKYTSEIDDPIRVTNYAYDEMGRNTVSDYRNSATALGSDQEISLPLTFSNANTLDTRTEYDLNGRVLGKRSGGVEAADSAIYTYYENSYRVQSVAGKLSTDSRRTDFDSAFLYDTLGRMVGDVSKNMQIAYTHDGLTNEIEVRGWPALNGIQEHVLYQFYDAAGERSSQVAFQRLATGFPGIWVGNPEGEEDADLYQFSTLQEAVEWIQYALNEKDYPLPDSLVIWVVADLEQEPISESTIDTIYKGETQVPTFVHGVAKNDVDYQELMEERAGAKTRASHYVSFSTGLISSEATETYDGSGDVVQRLLNATLFGRSGAHLGRLAYYPDSTVYQFYIKDHLGSVVRVVGREGDFVERPVFDYQASGEQQVVRDDRDNNPVSRGFTGKELDDIASLYYFGARWYDPELGLWTSPDPAWQYANPYSYVGGDAVNLIDPYGYWSWGRFKRKFKNAMKDAGNFVGHQAMEYGRFWRDDPFQAFMLTAIAVGGTAIGVTAIAGGIGTVTLTLGLHGATVLNATYIVGGGLTVVAGGVMVFVAGMEAQPDPYARMEESINEINNPSPTPEIPSAPAEETNAPVDAGPAPGSGGAGESAGPAEKPKVPVVVVGPAEVLPRDPVYAPLDKIDVTSAYGKIRDKGTSPHVGVDLRAQSPKPAYAPSNGSITTGSAGMGVVIFTFDKGSLNANYQVEFLHLSSRGAAPGKTVRVQGGDPVGRTGSVGADAPHLHIQVRNRTTGKLINPKVIYGGMFNGY